MRPPDAASMKEQIFSTAGEALGADLFWRGNLAKAVQRKDFKGTFWGVLVLSLFLFFYVWQHMQVVKLSYEVQSLKTQKQQLTNQYYYLKYRMHEVNSLSRVEKVAREQLGMVTPKSDQIVILDEGPDYYPKWFSFWTAAMKKVDKP
ncbi:MAG TPA: cell division protein FtsL [bacterium]|nr:cell division protein FtsL [bacterium]